MQCNCQLIQLKHPRHLYNFSGLCKWHTKNDTCNIWQVFIPWYKINVKTKY